MTKQLKEGQAKRQALQDARKAAEAALRALQKESKASEKMWKEKVRELQILNEVLQKSGGGGGGGGGAKGAADQDLVTLQVRG